ncbi:MULTISPECIES: hypothetical protein [Paraburkholderia]|uniref:hypothetical protein n=1 Tax=Paraburkholderia TaxID=1822464 RepID=UPI0038BA7CF4
MGLFDGSGDTGGGLMGMYANPQMAGLLGMSQGLLSAAGPSRIPVSMGQALGSGMQGMQQNAGNALQMQMQMAKMQAMMNPFGAPSGGGVSSQPLQQMGQPNPAMAQGAPVSGAANVGPMSGLSAGMGGLMQPQPQGAQPQGASAPSPTDPFSAMFGGHTPQEVMIAGARAAALGNPAGTKMMEMAAQYDPELARQMPTDIQKNAAAAYGYGTPQYQSALQGVVDKEGIVALRPGAPYIRGGQVYGTPGQAPQGYMNVPNGDGTWAVQQVAGGPEAVRSSAAAQAGGKAQYNLQQVWDPTANGGNGGFVYQNTANVADAAGGNSAAPVGIRNNNFGNIKGADGQFATYDTPQAGINAADQTLAAYGAKHGINTIAGIANRWAPAGDGNNNPAQKAAAMSAASGVGVNDPINLSDPSTRARILPALFDTETPGWRGALQGGASPAAAAARGPMSAQPPQGATAAANASQGAPSKQMADSYSALSNSDASYQQSREALTEMINLAHNKGATGTAVGLLPASVGTKISPDAATYQKLHATYVALQGKALGSGGTDAARATIDEAVPTYDKPQTAMVGGLTTQLNNLDLSHIKTQFLTPVYQQGNEKTYTQQSAAFDQNVKPSMVPALTLSGDAQRAAVQAAVKANPSLRPNFEWAFNNGLLK